MSCGLKNDCNDICGETYTCGNCSKQATMVSMILNLQSRNAELEVRVGELEKFIFEKGKELGEILRKHRVELEKYEDLVEAAREVSKADDRRAYDLGAYIIRLEEALNKTGGSK